MKKYGTPRCVEDCGNWPDCNHAMDPKAEDLALAAAFEKWREEFLERQSIEIDLLHEMFICDMAGVAVTAGQSADEFVAFARMAFDNIHREAAKQGLLDD